MTDQPFEPAPGEELREPTEDELRAAYEAELKMLRVEDVVVQTVVSLLNLGARRAGLVQGSEDEVDLEQARVAIEGVRALLPVIEPQLGPNAAQLREALSQLQLAYAQLAGGPVEPAPSGPSGPAGQGGGPQGEPPSRLWVPGQ